MSHAPSSDQPSEESDVFEVAESITIINDRLKLNTHISRGYVKEVEGRKFVLIDFYSAVVCTRC